MSDPFRGVALFYPRSVPIVVHPQLFDQVWHARRVQDLGLGLHARKPADVAAAIRTIAGDPAFAQRAKAFAATLAGEDGAAALADAAERLV